MKSLVIIPCTKIKYELGFSAPLAWLFGKCPDRVYGIYSFELSKEHIEEYNTFIIEINWYIELYEAVLIVDFIKKHNRGSKILFGGLFASLSYRKIFERFNIDYYIKGDNELPLEMFLSGKSPEEIPNFVGRDFEQDITCSFKEEDFKDLEFNLDWFPSYFRHLKDNPFQIGSMNTYSMPMIITSKGGCTASHEGCDYCMGSHHRELLEIYGRKPVIMDNKSLITLIKKIEKKFKFYSIMIISEYNYDFSGENFSLDTNIEVDSPVTIEQVDNIFRAFKRCTLIIPLYKEGKMGEKIVNYKEILTLEDEDHRIIFPAYGEHKNLLLDIPERNVLYNLDEGYNPSWATWYVYNDFELAFKNSKTIYEYYRKKNYPVFIEE